MESLRNLSVESATLRGCGAVSADQKAIWTSPIFSLRTHSTEWLCFTAGVLGLFVVDKRITAALPKTRDEIAVSRWASRIGTLYTTGIATLGVYAVGLLFGHDRARELGLLGIRTLCNTELICNPLKIVTQRPRPGEQGGSGRFWKGGYGFPSGHSMKSWALASAVTREFPHRRSIGILAYGFATTVSLARLIGFRHFASDAFAGAVMGWYIGALIQRRHRCFASANFQATL